VALEHRIALSGDMQGGIDALLLSGDMAPGYELTNERLAGGVLTAHPVSLECEVAPYIIASAALISPDGSLAGAIEISADIILAVGGLLASGGASAGAVSVSNSASAALLASTSRLDIEGGPSVKASGSLLSSRGLLDEVLRILVNASGALEVSDAKIDVIASTLITAFGSVTAGSFDVDGSVVAFIDANGVVQARPSFLRSVVQTSDALIAVGSLNATNSDWAGEARAQISALGLLAVTPAQINEVVKIITSAAADLHASPSETSADVRIVVRALGATVAGEVGVVAEIETATARRTVMTIFY